jgi:hypothetical protein
MKIYVSKIIKFQEPDQGSDISWSLGKEEQAIIRSLKHIAFLWAGKLDLFWQMFNTNYLLLCQPSWSPAETRYSLLLQTQQVI